MLGTGVRLSGTSMTSPTVRSGLLLDFPQHFLSPKSVQYIQYTFPRLYRPGCFLLYMLTILYTVTCSMLRNINLLYMKNPIYLIQATLKPKRGCSTKHAVVFCDWFIILSLMSHSIIGRFVVYFPPVSIFQVSTQLS